MNFFKVYYLLIIGGSKDVIRWRFSFKFGFVEENFK